MTLKTIIEVRLTEYQAQLAPAVTLTPMADEGAL